MAWIESHQEVTHHPKTRKLARRLNISQAAAIGHLHALWHWALSYAEDGTLDRHTDEDVALGALWEDDPKTFIDALVECRWMDRLEEGLALHDWNEYAGRLLDKRKANADRKRKARARLTDDQEPPEDDPEPPRDHPEDVPDPDEGRPRVSQGYLTEPNQTEPNPTEQNRTKETLAPQTAREVTRPRKVDPLFDALVAATGIDPSELTKPARGALNSALKDLRDAGALPTEIGVRAGNWSSVFPQATLTPSALAKHWPQLARERAPNRRPDRFVEMGKSLNDRIQQLGGDNDGQTGSGADQISRGLPSGERH